MSSWSWKAGLASVAILAATAYAAAQMSDHPGMPPHMNPGSSDQPMTSPQGGEQGQMHARMMQMIKDGTMPGGMRGDMDHYGMMGRQAGVNGQPSMPGQDAFGAIQEVVQMLESDPATDWSKVNIAALREHLIDMNEVTLHAATAERSLDNGSRNYRDGRRPDPSSHQADGPRACQRTRQDRLDRQDRGLTKWCEAYSDDRRYQTGDQAQGARLYGNHGPGRTPSAPPSDDRKGRISHALITPELLAGASFIPTAARPPCRTIRLIQIKADNKTGV